MSPPKQSWHTCFLLSALDAFRLRIPGLSAGVFQVRPGLPVMQKGTDSVSEEAARAVVGPKGSARHDPNLITISYPLNPR